MYEEKYSEISMFLSIIAKAHDLNENRKFDSFLDSLNGYPQIIKNRIDKI